MNRFTRGTGRFTGIGAGLVSLALAAGGIGAADLRADAGATADPDEGLTLLFADDFEGRAEPGDAWQTAERMAASWTVADGVLVGDQTTPDHGAVIRTPLDFADLDLAFDFNLDGSKRFNLVIDDKREKSVHAGHICRVSISPGRITVGDDKTGVMNQKIRELRKRGDQLSAREKDQLEKHLATCESSARVRLEQHRWYRLRVRIVGDVMETWLDGEPLTSLRSPGIAHPTKTQFGFTATGSVTRFDNVRVYAVTE